MTRQAFGLMELVLAVVVISLFSGISYSFNYSPNYDHLYFMNEYLIGQSKAMANNEGYHFKSIYAKPKYPISFLKDGIINMAQTIDFGHHKVIIRLGNGNINYE